MPDFDFLNQPGANGWTSYASLFRFVFEGFFTQPYEPISYALTSNNQGKGGCMFYNPLLTSLTNPNLANNPELLNWLSAAHLNDDRRNTLGVWDALVTGELFEMRGGTAAFALGGQMRSRAGLLPPTIKNAVLTSSFTLGAPSPDVGNEYADTYSASFIWTPDGTLDGLSVQADFWRFEVQDRVLPESGSSAIKRQMDVFNEVVGNPGNYVLNSSLDTAATSDLFVPCNPTALATQFGVGSTQRLNCVVDPRLYQVSGVEESLPSPIRNLIQLKLGAINAGEITADGVDVKVGYRWSHGWSNANLGTTVFTLGALDALNSDLPYRETGSLNYDATVFDGRGRRLYVRALWQF